MIRNSPSGNSTIPLDAAPTILMKSLSIKSFTAEVTTAVLASEIALIANTPELAIEFVASGVKVAMPVVKSNEKAAKGEEFRLIVTAGLTTGLRIVRMKPGVEP